MEAIVHVTKIIPNSQVINLEVLVERTCVMKNVNLTTPVDVAVTIFPDTIVHVTKIIPNIHIYIYVSVFREIRKSIGTFMHKLIYWL